MKFHFPIPDLAKVVNPIVTTTTLPLTKTQRIPEWLHVQEIAVLAVILVIAIGTRWHYAPIAGFEADLRSFAGWMQVIQTEGMLNFYEPQYRLNETDRTYPPLSTLSFALLANTYGSFENVRMEVRRPNFISLLKVLPVAAEIIMIVAVYVWLSAAPNMQRAVALGLALHPALIVVSGWWGQVDSMFTMCIVLSLICLNKDRPLWAWVFFAVALLLKQPALFFAPLILVLTFRRYGTRTTAWAVGLCAGMCVIAFVPFVLTSGFQNGLSPYLLAGDTFPFLTNNAYNTWYIISSGLTQGAQVTFRDPILADAQIWFAGLTYKTTGLLVFGTYALVLMVVVWRTAEQRREFVWAAALYFGFFMLPTQVHERYLYPAAALILVAVAQDRRLWWVALGVVITFTYNIMAVLDEGLMRDLFLSPAEVGVTSAAVNGVLFLALFAYTVIAALPRTKQAVQDAGAY